MASVLEATNALLDFDDVWPTYSPISPTTFQVPPEPLSSLPSSSSFSSGVPGTSDDDDSAIMTSVDASTTSWGLESNLAEHTSSGLHRPDSSYPDDDDSAMMTSMTTLTSWNTINEQSSSILHQATSSHPTQNESCIDLLSAIDFSVLSAPSPSSPSSDSAFEEGESLMIPTDHSPSPSPALPVEMGAARALQRLGEIVTASSQQQRIGENSEAVPQQRFRKNKSAPIQKIGKKDADSDCDKRRVSESESSKIRRPTSACNTLPPCRVCGDSASGFHYGVNTCEACKRFFRRALKRKRLFKCKGSKTCSLVGKKNQKHLCGHCRLARCLALGMSRTNIKTGRYTHQKRAQDSLEVQQLAQASSSSTSSPPPPSSSSSSSSLSSSSSSSSLSSSTTSSTSSSSSSSSSPSLSPLSPSPSLPFPVAIPEAEVEETVRKLLDAHAEILTNARVPPETLVGRAAETARDFKLKMDVFGIRETLTPEQYDEVFRETGLDVDERQKLMIRVAKSIDFFVRGYVRFGKAVLSFTDMPLEDQTNLLKLARPEVWFLGAYKGFLGDYDVFYAPNNDVRHRMEMEGLLGRQYVDCAFMLAACLQRLDLHFDEVVVLKAVCLTFSDRCQVQEPSKLEELQMRMLAVFMHLLAKNHPQGDDTDAAPSTSALFYKVVDCLVRLRNLSENSLKALAVTYFNDAIRHHSPLFELVLI